MQIYIISSCLIFAFGFICKLPTDKKAKKLFRGVFVFGSFLLLWFLSSFRVNVGNDYSMYIEGFFRMGRDSFSNLAYKDWEIGFVLLTKAIVYFTKNQTIYLMILSLLALAGPCYIIIRYSKNPLLSIMLYINLFFYYITLNFMRQAIAISIVCFAWTFMKNNKFLLFAVMIGVASLFHMTALIMIVVYFIVKLKPGVRTLLMYGYLLLFYYILSDGVLNILLSQIHTEYENSVFITNGISYVYVLLPAVICVALILAYRFIENIPNETKYLINLCIFAMFWLLVMTKHALFERFSYYTFIFIILAVPDVLHQFNKWLPNKLAQMKLKKGHPEAKGNDELYALYCTKQGEKQAAVIGNMIYIGIIAVTMAYQIYGLSVGTSGVHGVVPYTSVFEFLNF